MPELSEEERKKLNDFIEKNKKKRGNELRLKRNFAILIWLSCFIKDLKERSLRIKDLPIYFTSLFRVVFCRYKYIGINTKWATEWYWIKGSE